MKQIYFIATLMLISFGAGAQNLVSNCSFEQYTTCPTTLSLVSPNCVGWSPYTTGGSPDYFNACNTSTVGVPNNFRGYQPAAHGNAYVGGYTLAGQNNDYKEYVKASITPMTIGVTYRVSLSVSLANASGYGTDDLGVFFYDLGPTGFSTTTVAPVTPQVTFTTITDTTNWVRVSGTFYADSAYDNIVIGGFKNYASMGKTALSSATTSNYIAYYYFDSIVVEPDLQIITHLADSVFCPGASITVPYTISNSGFLAGNTFTLQLSGPTGSFASPTTLGVISSTTAGSISGNIPVSAVPGTGYRVRVLSSNPADTSAPDPITIEVKPVPIPLASSNSPLCEGSTLNLTANAIFGSSYSWTGPGSFTSSQQNPTITNTTTSHSGDYIVTATLNGCVGKDTVTVLVKTMPVVPTAGNNGPVCEGSTLSFTANSTTNGVLYTWTGPSSYSSTQQNPSITNSIIANSGVYSVTASLNGCTSASASTTAQVKPMPAAPTAANNSPVCAGETLNFTSSSSTPGVSYSWTGPNSFTSTSQNPSKISAPTDSGTYYVTATLNGCTSAAGTTHVDISPVTALGGWVSPNDTICEGTVATFVVVPSNPGPNPQYQWFRNGNLIAGATNTKYVTSNIATGDVFYCEMNAPNVCATTLHLTSNPIKMLVIPITLDPSVRISSVPAQPVPGQPAVFTAISVNGGYIPAYQWKRNGQDVYGAIYAIWNANNLAPYDKISCSVTSSDPCAVPKGANSDTIVVQFPTGINDINNSNGYSLYPNPNNGSFSLNIPASAGGEDVLVEVVNAVGQTILNSRFQNSNSKVEIELPGDVASGVYMLRISNGQEQKNISFTVYK